eukprot:g15387.t1
MFALLPGPGGCSADVTASRDRYPGTRCWGRAVLEKSGCLWFAMLSSASTELGAIPGVMTNKGGDTGGTASARSDCSDA